MPGFYEDDYIKNIFKKARSSFGAPFKLKFEQKVGMFSYIKLRRRNDHSRLKFIRKRNELVGSMSPN